LPPAVLNDRQALQAELDRIGQLQGRVNYQA
jgi:hypothetical protein